MTEPTKSTLKRLCAHSGNRCAFSECALPIFEESGAQTGTVCHIKARSPGGPRYRADQTDQERHGYVNLILLCARHSKIIDADTARYTVEVLSAMKSAHETRVGCTEVDQSDGIRADILLRDYRNVYNISATGNVMVNSPGAVQGNITIKTAKASLKMLPAPGSLGSSVMHRNYVKHLIERYQEFASIQPGRDFRYPVIYRTIKKEFGAAWDHIPLDCFDRLAGFLQHRIARTQLARINQSKGVKNYSTFEEYCAAHGGHVSGRSNE